MFHKRLNQAISGKVLFFALHHRTLLLLSFKNTAGQAYIYIFPSLSVHSRVMANIIYKNQNTNEILIMSELCTIKLFIS